VIAAVDGLQDAVLAYGECEEEAIEDMDFTIKAQKQRVEAAYNAWWRYRSLSASQVPFPLHCFLMNSSFKPYSEGILVLFASSFVEGRLMHRLLTPQRYYLLELHRRLSQPSSKKLYSETPTLATERRPLPAGRTLDPLSALSTGPGALALCRGPRPRNYVCAWCWAAPP